jgi:hypothetical protein
VTVTPAEPDLRNTDDACQVREGEVRFQLTYHEMGSRDPSADSSFAVHDVLARFYILRMAYNLVNGSCKVPRRS